tara:strand:- start:1208 stop:1390 length:183 start_codon:yes stop_codon:yes gene_type:complete
MAALQRQIFWPEKLMLALKLSAAASLAAQKARLCAGRDAAAALNGQPSAVLAASHSDWQS